MIGSSRFFRVGDMLSPVGWLSFVAIFCWIGDGLADSFYLKSGQVVEGDVIQATRNTVTVRQGGMIKPLSFGNIERVTISLADGSEISGDMFRWKDGVYEIMSADVVIMVKDGVLIDNLTETASVDPAATVEPMATESVAAAASPASPKARPTVAMVIEGMPEIGMSSGQVINGTIVHATGSIVTIRLTDGGLIPAPRAQIDTVKFSTDDGNWVSGGFVSWTENVYQLKSGDQEIFAGFDAEQAAAVLRQSASDDGVETTDAAIAPEDPPLSDSAVEALSTADDDDAPLEQTPVLEQAPKIPVDDLSDLGELTGAGGPVSEVAVAELVESQTAPEVAIPQNVTAVNAPHVVDSAVAEVAEGSDAVVFQFHLDRPADRPLVVLYAATDDTARAGQDFEPKSGVVTFNAGSEYAEVRVPLIDDSVRENNEQFHLFLSSDPEIIQFSQRQVPATITDND